MYSNKKLNAASKITGFIVALTGIVVLTGWIFNIELLKSLSPNFVSMKVNTAICFVLTGIVLLILNKQKIDTPEKQIFFLCSFLIFLTGTLTLIEYTFRLNLGIDQLFFQDISNLTGILYPGRMSPVTAVNFILLGAALVLKYSGYFKTFQLFTIIVLLLSFFTFLGYLFNVPAFYGIASYTRIALHTTLLFIIAGFGSLLLKPEKGITGLITSNNLGGIITRRLLPMVIIIPLLLGWLRLQGQKAGFYGTEFGTALLVLLIIIVFIGVIRYTAKHMINVENELQSSEAELKKLNESLEQQVKERTAALQRTEQALKEFNTSLEQKVMERTIDLKLINKELEESEKQIQTIFRRAPDAVVVIDEKGIIEKWNPRAEAIFGWTESEVIGKPLHEIIIPERYREAHQKGMKHFLKTGEGPVLNKPIELPALRKNDSEFQTELSISPFQFNEKYFFIGFIKDITERKIAEAKIKESEERFRLIVENVKDYSIISLDANGYIKTWNLGAERIKGYSAKEIIGKHISIMYTEDEILRKEPENNLKMAKKEGRFESECWHVRKDGSKFFADVIYTALYDANNNFQGFAKITRDITERIKAESEIKKKSEELTQTNKELVVQIEEKEKKAEEVKEQNIKLIETREKIVKLNEKLESTVIERTKELELAYDRVQEFNDELKDVNKSKDKFISIISHDLRNPVTAILSSSEIMMKNIGTLKKEDIKKLSKIINNSSIKIVEQLNELVAWSKQKNKKINFNPQKKNLYEFVGVSLELIDAIAKQKNIEIANNIDENLKVNVDPLLLRSIFQNLITNSIKFTPKGGKITITASNKNESFIEVSIKDTGMGMPEEVSSKLFSDESVIAKPGADSAKTKGLGLILVKDFVEKHQGKIWVESEPGKGTTIYFTLPVAD